MSRKIIFTGKKPNFKRTLKKPTKNDYPIEKKVRNIKIFDGKCANYVRVNSGSVFCLTENKNLEFVLTTGLLNCASMCIIIQYGNTKYVFLNHHTIDDEDNIKEKILDKTVKVISRCIRKKYPDFTFSWDKFLSEPLKYKMYFVGQDIFTNPTKSLAIKVAKTVANKLVDIDNGLNFHKYKNIGMIEGNNIAINTKTLEVVKNIKLGTKYTFHKRENGYGNKINFSEGVQEKLFLDKICN